MFEQQLSDTMKSLFILIDTSPSVATVHNYTVKYNKKIDTGCFDKANFCEQLKLLLARIQREILHNHFQIHLVVATGWTHESDAASCLC